MELLLDWLGDESGCQELVGVDGGGVCEGCDGGVALVEAERALLSRRWGGSSAAVRLLSATLSV